MKGKLGERSSYIHLKDELFGSATREEEAEAC
jgi:hypothetical protein